LNQSWKRPDGVMIQRFAYFDGTDKLRTSTGISITVINGYITEIYDNRGNELSLVDFVRRHASRQNR